MKHRAISTAEKKLLLAEPGEWSEAAPPLAGWYPVAWKVCGCHSKPCTWMAQRRASGGSWRCRVAGGRHSREWCERHPERRSETNRSYHRKNRGAVNERQREWRKKNPESVRRRNRKWREQRVRKASAVRQRLAKLNNLKNNPSATPAERETARLHAARLTERMIHGS